MKKKKNTLLAVGLLLAIIGLGVGYAINNQELKVGGTATAGESASSFNVKFKSASPTTTQTTTDDSGATLTSVVAAVNDSDPTKATMNVSLTNLNDEVTATFVVENTSQKGLAAKIDANNVKIYQKDSTTTYNSEYFDVTTNIVTTTIPSVTGNEMSFTVTVKLKKAFVGTSDNTSITENFDIVLEDIEAVQE